MIFNYYKYFLSLLIIFILFLIIPIYAQSISISNIVDLQKIGNDPSYPLNGNYVLTQDIDASDTINWNSGAGFKPIGDSINPFTGSFDGKNYGIYNLYINRQTEYAGLFGQISGGSIHNVLLLNCNIKGYLYAGALAGLNAGGNIIQCGVSSSIIYGTGNIDNSVGGLVGGNSGLVESCVVSKSMIIDTYAQYGVGGLIGYNQGGIITNSCVYSSSYTTSVTGAYGVGGLVGILENSEKNTGSVINCYSSATIMGTLYVGGLIGFNNEGAVTSSYWDTTVSGMILSDGGTGKTTDQMRQQTTYIGWDFTNVWIIEEGVDYPYLRWIVTIENLVEMPDVVGLNIDLAITALRSAGFTGHIEVIESCNNMFPISTVIEQDPLCGALAPAESPIILSVSSGPCSISLPNFLGISETNADRILNELGLEANINHDCNNVYPAGVVFAQEPEVGSSVSLGSLVTLFVSTGPCLIAIPNVVGMNGTEAINLLRSAGFSGDITTSYECNETVASGAIISQEPAQGIMILPSENIELVISRGPCSVEVPNLIGMNETIAINMIQSLNLIAGVWYDCNDTVPEGTVFYQEPYAGTILGIDSNVYIVVSTGPCEYVIVPDVLGMTEANAKDTLQQLGFEVTVDYECNEEFPEGTVIGQWPQPLTEAIKNSEVHITVSAGTCPPIGITSIEELQKIGNDPNYPIYGNYLLTQDIDAEITTTWNDGKGFIPIGTWEKPFRGTFDGQNHFIYNLYINNSEKDYSGLFGVVTSPAKIKNLMLLDSVITGYYYIGAIAGIVVDSDCEITECTVISCYISGISNDDSIGGFVGGNAGKILRCVAEDVLVNGDKAEYGVGGFVGLNYGGNITDSFIYSGFIDGNSFIGGLVGYQINYEKSFNTNVLNCYSVATISGNMYVGGLVGYNDGGTTVASYWDTTISGIIFSDGGTGKTTSEMYQQATYEGWDFVNTWVSYEGTNYPILKWVVDLYGEGEGSPEGEIPITVPNVTGMTEQQARNVLESAGLNRIQVTYNCSNTVAQGNVLSQVPSAGEEISPRVYVQLSISNGLCPGVVVPDVVGRTEQQAKDVIQIADLTVKVEKECNNYVAQGFVIRQSPVAYSGVNRKSEITIWVSTGSCSGTTYITVPNVIGQNVTSATGQLQAAGLSVRTVSQYSDTIAQNTVMGQSPVGGTSVISGTPVELIVSAGPDPAGAKISTPRGLQTFSGIDHVYLVWEANTERNLVGYRLERSETRTGPWTTVSTNIITGTNYRDNGVDTSKLWYYRLIAVGTNGQQSEPTEPVKAEPGKLRVWIPQIDWLPEGSGDTIQVPINISSARGLEPYTIDINVSYNNTVLELVEVQQTAVTRNLNVLSPDTRTQGVIKFHAGPRVDNEKKVLYGEGRLFDMVFRVRQNTAQGNCSQDTNLTLQRVLIKDKDLKELPVELVHGQLNILEENPNNNCINSRCIYGDLDTDGYIGMSDTIMFLRKIVRKAGITDVECDKRRGDFNGDGILDCADVSLLLRRLAGLPTNPTAIAIGSKALLEIESNRTVEVVLDNSTPDTNNEYHTGIELNSLSGVAGMDLVLAYDEGINFSGLSLPAVASGFKKDTEAGEGYLKISISSEKSITSSGKGRILQINFKPTTTETKTIKIQIREVKVKGEFGDDLSWYGEINTKGTTITTIGAEQFLNDLKTNFNSIDTNNDGKISYEEAVAQYPTLTREAFNSADTNKDGYIDKAEAGITINEGIVEGTTEGASEGTLIEGSVEGSSEGEGEGQNGGGGGICGCKKSKDFNDGTWKYLLDFVLFGMLMFAMSGMKRKK